MKEVMSVASIEAVRQRFIELHEVDTDYIERLNLWIEELTNNIESGQVCYQAERRSCLAERKRLERRIGLSEHGVDEILQDFDDIVNHEQVRRVDLGIDGSIEVMIRATINYQSVDYFIGNWVFAFGHNKPVQDTGYNSRGLFSSWCVGSGVKDEPYAYPDYTLCSYRDSGEENLPFGFCFGPLEGRIGLHLVRGEIKSAIYLAILSFSSVNEKDQHLIPKRFYSFEEIWKELNEK